MNKVIRLITHPVFIILLVLIFDQTLKIWVKTHMMLNEEFPVFENWFYIHFTENPGMAFGFEFGGKWGKLMLSLFRIVAVSGIGYYLFKLPKTAPKGFKICIALVFAGAIGNIIDSAFYGLIFNDSLTQVATLFPPEGGYASFLHGRVVDMLYFPLIEGFFPDWLPIWGGEYFMFFRPVFNIADSAITIGIISLILFQRKYFKEEFSKK
jgi:signal peptidase II